MRTLSRSRIGAALILGLAVTCALAATPATKVISLGKTSISVAWDPAWNVTKPGPDLPPDTVQIQTADSNDMLVLVSAEVQPALIKNADAFMRHVMDRAVEEFGPHSVETKLVPKAFANGATRGYRVCATDRAPKPGEWKYICQGVAVVGDTAVIFSMLYNESGKAQAEKANLALEALQVVQRT